MQKKKNKMFQEQKFKDLSTPMTQYNLHNFPITHQGHHHEDTQQNRMRSLPSKRIKTQSVVFNKVQEKLQAMQAKIQEIKASLYKKNLQRMKKNVLRTQQLQQIKKSLQQMSEIKIFESPQKQNKVNNSPRSTQKQIEKFHIRSNSTKKYDNNKLPQKKDKQKNQKDGINQQGLKLNLKDFVTQQKQTHKINLEETLHGFVTTVPETNAHAFQQNPYSPRDSTYYVTEVLKGYKDHNSIVYQHLKISIALFNHFSHMLIPNNTQVKKRAVNLPLDPKYEGKKTIIFDLDETLIHCTQDLKKEHQTQIKVTFPKGEVLVAGINIRPGAVQILKALHKNFELMVFTASFHSYANVVIDLLDPNKQYIQHRLFRQHCFITRTGQYVKDLRIINRDLKNMVLVDNAAYSYAFQPENGIPIIPYYHGDKDFQLKMLTSYIQKLAFCKDVRLLNRQTFKLTHYRNYKPQQVHNLVQDLYINKIV